MKKTMIKWSQERERNYEQQQEQPKNPEILELKNTMCEMKNARVHQLQTELSGRKSLWGRRQISLHCLGKGEQIKQKEKDGRSLHEL